ncbi:MAG: AtpZ/AtpI family protein [Balneolaceae bacterium]|nr:AtpZ/AtpI family protein [Balneolaceae bacterium]
MSEKSTFSKYAPYLSLGLEIAVGISLPILIGYWLDEYFETSPWLLLVGCVLGMINVFVIIFRLSKKLNDDS